MYMSCLNNSEPPKNVTFFSSPSVCVRDFLVERGGALTPFKTPSFHFKTMDLVHRSVRNQLLDEKNSQNECIHV